MSDPFDLTRFLRAQDSANTYVQALAELRNGRKVSHWMWFVFPQIVGLGRSTMSKRYAIKSLAEAAAYLDHDLLGPRLLECAGVVTGLENRSACDIFGGIDALKLRSSMTLFSRATIDEPVFTRVLEIYFDGQPHPDTLRIIDPPGEA